MQTNKYDIIVVGAGHAGCEAASAAANMGSKVLLITMNMNTIAQMSCNPAMGGVAKGSPGGLVPGDASGHQCLSKLDLHHSFCRTVIAENVYELFVC